jgi:hypothetical protein
MKPDGPVEQQQIEPCRMGDDASEGLLLGGSLTSLDGWTCSLHTHVGQKVIGSLVFATLAVASRDCGLPKRFANRFYATILTGH